MRNPSELRSLLLVFEVVETLGPYFSQRLNGITFPPSKNVLIPSSAAVRSNSANASSSLGKRSSQTVEVPDPMRVDGGRTW